MNAVLLSAGHVFEPWTVAFVGLLLAPVAGLGVIANALIVKMFLRPGISDGVMMSLMSLAASDLLYLIPSFVIAVSMVLHGVEVISGFEVWFPLDPETVYMISTNVGSCFYVISMLVTTFITVVRCLAVVDPLKYRNLISLKSTAVVISSFAVVSVLCAVLLLAYMGVSPQYDSNINSTRLYLWISPQRALVKDVIFGARDVFLPLASQIIVGVCVVVMASYLQKALKVRRYLSGNTKSHIITSRQESTQEKLVGKELKVARQMLIIAVVYSLCNMPKVVFNLTQIILPEFYRGGRYGAAYLTFNIIRELIQSLNASVTFCIYWKYNSKFRSHFVLSH